MKSKRLKNKEKPVPVAAAHEVARWLEPAAMAAILCLFVVAFLVDGYVAYATSAASSQTALSFVSGWNIFGVDDAYRYFLARSAWINPSLYAWNYDLPAGLVVDGALSSLTGGNLVAMRLAHIPFLMLSLWFLYMSGRRLGVHRLLMAFSLLLLAFMPLYSLVMLSFLGEGWLTFFLCLALFLFTSGRYRACAFAVGLMPLVRPDGIFFVILMAGYFLKERRPICFFLLMLPGFIYFLYLLFALTDYSFYMAWRNELRRIMNVVYDDRLFRVNALFSVCNPLWVTACLASFMVFRQMRRLWPFFVSVLVVAAFFYFQIWRREAYFEARYFTVVIPMLLLSWAVFMQSVVSWSVDHGAPAGVLTVMVLCSTLVLVENLRQNDQIESVLGGSRWPLPGLKPLLDFQRTPHFDNAKLEARRRAVSTIYEQVRRKQDIDALVVGDVSFFYDLDPHMLPRRVRVSFSVLDLAIIVGVLGGSAYVMHPEGVQYAYFNFWSNPAPGKPSVLYASVLPEKCTVCYPVFNEQGYKVYWLGYSTSSLPARWPGSFSWRMGLEGDQ